jgi:diguanylate cyclase (GGDEF)-like protein/PAS domain S-box-containing protein
VDAGRDVSQRRAGGIALLCLALLVMVAAGVTILVLQARADSARRFQVKSLELNALVSQHSTLEWRAIAERGVSDDAHLVLVGLQARERAALAEMAAIRGGASIDTVGGDLKAYSASVDRELALLDMELFDQARGFDEATVDPAFAALDGSLERMAADAGGSARSAVLFARFGIGLVLLLGLSISAVLLWRFMAARSMRDVAIAQDETLRRSEARFRALIQHASDIVTLVDEGGVVTYQSPSAERLLSVDPAAAVGRLLSGLVHPDDRARLAAGIIRSASDDPAAEAVIECRFRDGIGAWRPTETIVTDLRHEPSVGAFVLNTRDVSERAQLQSELIHQAFHDALTGLANRTLFHDRVEHALTRRPDSGEIAVLFVDLDDFKTVNDTLGHAAGDRLLREVASRLTDCVRPIDTVARLGGDEFAVLVDAPITPEGATEMAERILAALRTSPGPDQATLARGASVGVAMGAPGDGADDLLQSADVAMYIAKGAGKGCHALFEPGMHAALVDRLALIRDLRHAIEDDGLPLVFQPIVSVATGEIVGLEALARWNHPTRGPIGPNEFIPLAEQTGLIVPLGLRVLERACAEARRWQDLHPERELTMSVNVSEHQLRRPEFVEEVRTVLAGSGLAPERLILELTESVLIDEQETTIERLNTLKALGVGLAIDDFGTGYSSLSYLSRLPVDSLKVDKAFIDGLGDESGEGALAEAIIALAQRLNLRTVAEGVEGSAQMRTLVSLGCDLVQGFHLSRPLDPEAVTAILRDGLGVAPEVLTAEVAATGEG